VPTIVGLAGSPSMPSRTCGLVRTVIDRIAAKTGAKTRLVDLAELVPDLGIRGRADASPRLEEALAAIEGAGLLIVGAPVYKGSYPGLFKHLIDLLEYPCLVRTPVACSRPAAATGTRSWWSTSSGRCSPSSAPRRSPPPSSSPTRHP